MLHFVLWDKMKKVSWSLLVAYGAAQEEQKNDFLTELAAFCNNVSTPFIVGGDEVLTRQCPCLGLSIHGESVGAWRIRRLQT
jgi:hypothetical protein